jgi:RNase adaptor protein for sRNA GlmZ degradation
VYEQQLPNNICVGCKHNKFPYCYNEYHPAGFLRIDNLPPNFVCQVREVEKKQEVKRSNAVILTQLEMIEKMAKMLVKVQTKVNKMYKIITDMEVKK